MVRIRLRKATGFQMWSWTARVWNVRENAAINAATVAFTVVKTRPEQPWEPFIEEGAQLFYCDTRNAMAGAQSIIDFELAPGS